MTTSYVYCVTKKMFRRTLTVSLAHLAGEEREHVVLGVQGVDLALHISCVFCNILSIVSKTPKSINTF